MGGAPSLGAQTAAIVQFIVLMIFIGPLMSLVLPASVAAQIFGTNGIGTQTSDIFIGNYVVPVLQQANSSSGFMAAGSLAGSGFSALAFIYGALGMFWHSLLQMPKILWMIFYALPSAVSFLPVTFGELASMGILVYITIGNFYKVLSGWQKTDMENVGS